MPWTTLVWMAALGFALAACDADDDCVCDDDDMTAGDDDTGDDDSSPTDDADGDGFTAAEGDCDDTDAAIHPAADEGCGDGVDSDCDGVEDSGCRLEIEAGDVEVGSNETSEVVPGQFISYWDERPQHTVALSAFAIELYEVTNFQYRRCLADGSCTAPDSFASRTRPDYFEDPQFGGYPVTNITWQQATDYCTWRGGRLPTEAQWEMAAKGPSPANPQAPWGELVEIDDWYANCDLGNYGLCLDDTARIGSYPDGKSAMGLFDMTGNVAEWVDDWYHSAYYGQSPSSDPPGADDGRFKVLRGGSWTQGWYDGRTVRRKYSEPDRIHDGFGVRCVFDPA
jgi:formylglycine-generating enzyme required for sulfatase activity